MKIALAAANMGKPLDSLAHLKRRLDAIALETSDCDVLVLPEYWAMGCLDFAKESLRQTEEVAWLAQELYDFDLVSKVMDTAERFDIAILPGTWPVRTDEGYKNRAFFITENGIVHYQDKLSLTDEETDRMGWYLKPGESLDIFEFDGKTCAIAICHDTSNKKEFVDMKDNWVDLIFMPSMCEFEGNVNTVDGHLWIFEHARKRSKEVGCHVACVGSIGTQVLGDDRYEKNVGGAALYKDGVAIAEIGPFEKGRGASAVVLKVEI